MLSAEGGSRALLRKGQTSLSPSSLMVRDISWRGGLSISGVMCRGILEQRRGEEREMEGRREKHNRHRKEGERGGIREERRGRRGEGED